MSIGHARTARLDDRSLEAIVIGGSAGVLDVLRIALAALPERLSIPVLVVVHLPVRSHSAVHESLQSASALPMSQAEDKEPLEGGHVYFASPGYHLLIEADRRAALSIDEPVYFSRPSIDVLFESASDVYGQTLLGILLTGASADGAAGLQTIHARGGLTVVQDPDTCEVPVMPQAALDLFRPDYVLAPSAIASLLANLDTGIYDARP
jgi:two-component system chemotaxis response regulator CheB